MLSARLFRPALAFAILCGACLCSSLPVAAAINTNIKTFHLDGATQWLDTGIDLNEQDQVNFQATGSLNYENHVSTPTGLPRGWRDLLRALPLNGGGTAALIGRIGPAEAPAFLIGSRLQHTVSVSGRLYLGVNRLAGDAISGAGFDVTVQWTSSSAATAAPAQPATAKPASAVPANAANPAGSLSPNPALNAVAPATGSSQPPAKLTDLPATTLKIPDLPIRLNDGKGHDGDMVNLLLIGTKEQVMAAYAAAGWNQADKSVKEAVLHGALSTFSKDAYLAMPMSQLMLFGRYQDLAYEHAEAVSVAASRHHLRLWKAPFQLNGSDVWVGAATHDIGFDRDNRNGGITHKIDPDVDLERSYVRDSLWNSGLVTSAAYYTPSQPLTTAKTATGEEFHSDGRLLVLDFKRQSTRAADFAARFCSVLTVENPDGGSWSGCESYLADKPSGSAAATLAPLPTDTPVLILPGFFSDCLTTSQPFHEALEHLKTVHNIKGEFFPLQNLSSAENARLIAAYINSHFDGTHKYLVIGYSKGATDGYEALATVPELKGKVAAFVSVAGAVGGSRLVDVIPGGYARWLKATYMQCQGDLTAAIGSLSYRNRQKFLADNPSLGIPTYTVLAQSDRAQTSNMMAETWQIMSVYGLPQDGQLLAPDATIPGSQYLGAATADHLSVAINFATTTSIPASMRDHNLYPRAALLEAIVRLVTEDVNKASY
ncbi:MAG TPA: LssY C-terminal domain-containing protein [Alphaproteobacteria bacterium]|nr:LssY C-terminal domain-containing protein [Alphaproteobacteria bacterium]